MSVLVEIKGLVLSGLKNEDERVKKAAIRVFNAIDADLDAANYDPASEEAENEPTAIEVLNAVKDLNEAFVELAEEIDTKGAESTGEDLPKSLTDEDDGN